jgi:hypothetical protein
VNDFIGSGSIVWMRMRLLLLVGIRFHCFGFEIES